MRTLSVISHLDKVEDEFAMGGLSTGLYGEYANDVAVSFAKDLLYALREDGKLSMSDDEIYKLFESHVETYDQ